MATGQKKRPLTEEPLEANKDRGEIFSSSPIHDRASTFVAHYHPNIRSGVAGSGSTSFTSSIKALQSHPAFQHADHRMVAWRRRSNQSTLTIGPAPIAGQSSRAGNAIYTTGSDDDGENYAGRKLERVLEAMDVEGAVVVARWYGGVLLGPVRFTHIENAAREAIGKFKATAAVDVGSKRAKLEVRSEVVDDEAERSRLAKQLTERDRSIVVLRGLLAEKMAAQSQSGPKSVSSNPKEAEKPASEETMPGKVYQPSVSTSTPPAKPTPTSDSASHAVPNAAPSPARQIDYTAMPLARLRQLEKARDATIAFVLKELDKAEEEEKRAKANGEAEQRTPDTTADNVD